ncbi:hypothetical protein Vretimale_15335, partial [Volvox reticuliferus]
MRNKGTWQPHGKRTVSMATEQLITFAATVIIMTIAASHVPRTCARVGAHVIAAGELREAVNVKLASKLIRGWKAHNPRKRPLLPNVRNVHAMSTASLSLSAISDEPARSAPPPPPGKRGLPPSPSPPQPSPPLKNPPFPPKKFRRSPPKPPSPKPIVRLPASPPPSPVPPPSPSRPASPPPKPAPSP